MAKQKNISFKVNPGMNDHITNAAKASGMNKSEFIKDCIKNRSQTQMFSQGGVTPITPEEETGAYLISMGGGSLVGIGIHNVVKDYLEQNKPAWKREKRNFVAYSTGVVSAIIVGMGIFSLMTKKYK